MKRISAALAAFGLMAGLCLAVPTQARAQEALIEEALRALFATCKDIADPTQKDECVRQAEAKSKLGQQKRADQAAGAKKKASAMGEKKKKRRN